MIGEGASVPGLRGPVELVYADYVASGRALAQVEDFIAEHVLPFYANCHTEASYCGAYMTRLRTEARREIARLTGAHDDYSVIFCGSGATAALNKLVGLLGIEDAHEPVVFIGPYEHHSNILPWRESKARVIQIAEGPHGGPDLEALQRAMDEYAHSDLKIGCFSAASNVTGIITDVAAVTRLLKSNGALSVWDYAGGGPYMPIAMASDGIHKDAVVISPHKFPGGPGASGVLIVNNTAVKRDVPTAPGGGTVTFVSPWTHEYSSHITVREEAGTPDVIGDIRASLAFIVKDMIGQERISAREEELCKLGSEGLSSNPKINLLGLDAAPRLPIFSFQMRGRDGELVHQQLVTRLLSDIYGIQARGGCACAGPYLHQLLDIDRAQSERLRDALKAGKEIEKPGSVRFNLSYLMSDRTARYIIDSINHLSDHVDDYAQYYVADTATARFRPAHGA
ncbi:aminotransferase class V-fold PLP-dependent enzyme [Erythrobacter aureus]|uniref:aminotransferase class V-fold PLP-dependent enzyme n=1 Tax=Erythrobacter aureus TaxID=2182384 RepID=UPI003A9001CB